MTFTPTTGPARDEGPPTRRRRRRRWLFGGGAVLVVGIAAFAIAWEVSGAHEVPLSTAGARFLRLAHGHADLGESGRPAEGVYSYRGSGRESLSLPPKTQYEGPLIPGTVIYDGNGCWAWRLDFSDNHWQSATYCPHGRELLETARGGWYRWDFVALSIADSSSYTCKPAEVAVPSELVPGRRYRFSCTGTNGSLKIPPVTLAGWVQYERLGSVRVGGKDIESVRVLETAHFTGGQSGTDVEDTWYERADGLPLEGTWSTDVRTPTPLGDSTLTASGRFQLSSVLPLR